MSTGSVVAASNSPPGIRVLRPVVNSTVAASPMPRANPITRPAMTPGAAARTVIRALSSRVAPSPYVDSRTVSGAARNASSV